MSSRKNARVGRVAVIGAVLAGLLMACGSDSDSTESGGGDTPTGFDTRDAALDSFPDDVLTHLENLPDELVVQLAEVRASGPSELVWVDAGGLVAEGWRNAFLDDWEKITGWKAVSVFSGADVSAAAVKKEADSGSPEWDIFTINDYASFQRLAGEDVWAPWDLSMVPTEALPAQAYIVDEEGNLIQGGGEKYEGLGLGVGIEHFGIVLMYNTDVFSGSNAPTSTLDIFDTDRFPGKRCMFNYAEFSGNLEYALMSDGVAFEDVYDELASPGGMDRALDRIDSIYDDIVFINSGSESVQFVLDGQCDMSITYSGRPATAVKDDPSLPLAITWQDAMMGGGPWGIVRGTKNFDAAESLMAFLLQPDRQCAGMNETGYGNILDVAPYPDCLTDFAKTWGPKYDQVAGISIAQFFAENADVESDWTAWQTSH